MNNLILVYVTCGSKTEAQKIAKSLLEDQLIACANFWPMNSTYLWENKVKEDQEYVLILKTKANLYAKVQKAVAEIHSYETPCIIKMNGEANAPFAEWVNKNTL